MKLLYVEMMYFLFLESHVSYGSSIRYSRMFNLILRPEDYYLHNATHFGEVDQNKCGIWLCVRYILKIVYVICVWTMPVNLHSREATKQFKQLQRKPRNISEVSLQPLQYVVNELSQNNILPIEKATFQWVNILLNFLTSCIENSS